MIGIGGIGMSGIAEYLLKKKIEVTGSDLNLSFITERLESLGAVIYKGHSESNIPLDADIVIYSSAVKEDNPEYISAKNNNIRLLKRAVILGFIVNDKILISVAGTHGKTTTAAMIGKLLLDAGLDPDIFCGGNLDYLNGASSRIGDGNYAVVEADEYDRSFHTLKSDIIVITNIDLDHTDFYKDIEDIKNSFRIFIENRKINSKIVIYGENDNTVNLTRNILTAENKSDLIMYGKDDDEYNYSFKNIFYDLQIIGEHNVLNSLAALCVSNVLGIDKTIFRKSIESFNGVGRRLELKYDGDIKIYDDYAHHPYEIYCSLTALKKISKRKLITVFQPHTYTRTRDFYGEFANSLALSDIIILAGIYPAREKYIDGVTSLLILNELKKYKNIQSCCSADNDEIIRKLLKIVQKDDVVVFQGAGDITLLCGKFVSVWNSKKNSKND